jgi:hypothetical protein
MDGESGVGRLFGAGGSLLFGGGVVVRKLESRCMQGWRNIPVWVAALIAGVVILLGYYVIGIYPIISD